MLARIFTLTFIFLQSSVLSFAVVSADSSKNTKDPKHYFSTTLYFNWYSTPKRTLRPNKLNLTTYQYAQSSGGFYVPIITKDYQKKDSSAIPNLSVLLVGNYINAIPLIGGLQNNHVLSKTSLGLRFFYNNGYRNVWFISVGPQFTQDNKSKYSLVKHSTFLLVFNKTVSEKMSWRLGFTKTFLFGNRYHLPVIGFRYGRLDGFYMSLQFPRSVSFNFPLGRDFSASVYCKPMGGIYDFANIDTLYNGVDTSLLYNGNDSIILFGRKEFITGINLTYNPNRHFSIFISSGFTMGNTIAFSSNQNNPNKFQSIKPFFVQNIESSYYINFGMTFRFGKVKKVYNNYSMYDMMDLNNSFDPGDNNDNVGNSDIPKKGNLNTIRKIQSKDIEDLIDVEDIYNQ